MKKFKPLRILHVIDYFYPQLGYQETFLSMAEMRQGYDVYVLTSNYVDKTIYEANKGIFSQKKTALGQSIEREIKIIRIPAFHLPFVNVLYLLGMEEVIAKLKPDVIICHGLVFLKSVKIAMLRKRLPEVKLIFDDHMTYINTRGGIFYFIYALFKWALTPLILKSANAIVAVTYETSQFMEQIYGIPKHKIRMIPLGVDTKLFRQDPIARKEIRSKYDLHDDDVVFIYAGKIIRKKGPHLLIEAAIKIAQEYPNIKIMFVGEGKYDYMHLINSKINSSGFRNFFVFVPTVTNEVLYKYYSAADIGVWPLQCSITILEAMSCGLPVIISNNSSVSEWINEENGLMYRAGDVEDLVEKMRTVLDPKLRGSMSLNAREYAKKNDWNIISKKFLELVGIHN
jgi:glycosyltransferase involved in cell wall biosynthesis